MGRKEKTETKLKRNLAWLSVKCSPLKQLAQVQGVHKPSVSLSHYSLPLWPTNRNQSS